MTDRRTRVLRSETSHSDQADHSGQADDARKGSGFFIITR
jgi:hypothetical protein